ncbi:flagellar filament capping protein FliD [Telmatobacter bradus]|uniref:flagellar filament capping protein FliD n=1 Tax=Telmatobacter bradus TaxID=474953 RepID=UPI003B432660
MNTVGLNFGSPTGGKGFDVSATVASIVSNLQNVETPWKTQLSNLKTQDTTISSLGTLLSTLSTDLSSLTEANGILSEKTGSSSNTNVLALASASNSAAAGAHSIAVNSLAQTSSGYLAEVSDSQAKLSGALVLQVGTATAQTISVDPSSNTLSGLAQSINASGVGVTASVLSDATGSRLSLVSGTSGKDGTLSITGNTVGISSALSYSSADESSDGISSGTLGKVSSLATTLSGSLTIQVGSGTAQTISIGPNGSTIAGLADSINAAGIGVTAKLVNNDDGTSSLKLTSGIPGADGALTVNSSISTITPPLDYTSAVTGADASLTIDGIQLTSGSNTVSNLIPGLTMQLLAPSSADVQVVIANYTSGAESAMNQFVNDYNKLLTAINSQEGYDSSGNAEPLFGSPTLSMLQQDLLSSVIMHNPTGYFTSVPANNATKLTGSLVIQAGTADAQTIAVDSSNDTIDGLASSINSANIGVAAAVVSKNGTATLTLTSQLSGTAGALKVNSDLAVQPGLNYADAGFTTSTPDSGSIGSLTSSGDTLSGTMTITVGKNAAQTISVDPANNTLNGLMDSINNAGIGVTAALSNDGTKLTLTSDTPGTAGALAVNSNLTDTSTSPMSYTNSSDINTISGLGISSNNNGTIQLDASALDSKLNTDFKSVQALFQNANSWGQSVYGMLNNASSSSNLGMMAMALRSNANTESTLNADISREETQIASEQKRITGQLTKANEVLQDIPSQVSEVNEIYSAISGYNQKG